MRYTAPVRSVSPLGVPTTLQAPPVVDADALSRTAVRYYRWEHLALLWRMSSLKSIRGCRRRASVRHGESPSEFAELGTSDGRASMVGVRTCGNIHACPTCAPRVRAGRAAEISSAVRRHESLGGEVLFLTLTVPHDAGMPLAPLLESVTGAWSALTGRRDRVRFSEVYGWNGSVRAVEVTHGSNGWHPHLHVLLFLDAPLSDLALACLRSDVFAYWADSMQARGLRRPTQSAGIKLVRVARGGELGQYLTKVGGGRIDYELARNDLKAGRWKNRSPWQILSDVYDSGEVSRADHDGSPLAVDGKGDLELWWEYEQATYRKNAITWSHGLKRRFGVQDITDQQHAEASTGHVSRLAVRQQVWRRLCDRGWATALLGAVEYANDHLAEMILVDQGGAEPCDWRWLDPPPSD